MWFWIYLLGLTADYCVCLFEEAIDVLRSIYE
jgi:hypothetical protein